MTEKQVNEMTDKEVDEMINDRVHISIPHVLHALRNQNMMAMLTLSAGVALAGQGGVANAQE